ncbi:MAG: cytochrome P450 [Chloroflexota bacterium]
MKSYSLYGPEFKANPFPTYAEMRQNSPVCYHPGIDGENKIWFVTGAKEVETVLRDHKRFVKNWRNTLTPEELAEQGEPSELVKLLDQHMLNLDSGDHARLRGLINKAFTPRMVNQMQGRVQSIADSLLDEFAHLGQADLIDTYAFPLPIVVIMEMLGIPVEDRQQFRIWSHAFIAPTINDEEWQNARQLLTDFTNFLRDVFDERRRAPQDDLISGLIEAEEAGDKLSEAELFGMVILLIVAGHETTTNLIGNGVLALLQYPDQLAKLMQDPTLIDSAIEEMLRYDGPVERATMRFAAEDIELGGQCIQRKDAVSVALSSANRDDKRFDAPNAFDITRQNNKHLGFGYGVHYCVGAQLARMEGAIAIKSLFQRLPHLRLDVPVESLTWDTVPIIRGMKEMPMAWDL